MQRQQTGEESLPFRRVGLESRQIDSRKSRRIEPRPVVHLEVIVAKVLVSQGNAGIERAEIHRRPSPIR
jgi:hypothetical protein